MEMNSIKNSIKEAHDAIIIKYIKDWGISFCNTNAGVKTSSILLDRLFNQLNDQLNEQINLQFRNSIKYTIT